MCFQPVKKIAYKTEALNQTSEYRNIDFKVYTKHMFLQVVKSHLNHNLVLMFFVLKTEAPIRKSPKTRFSNVFVESKKKPN